MWVREALPASLKTVETFCYSSPENKILLETLAQGSVKSAEFVIAALANRLPSLGNDPLSPSHLDATIGEDTNIGAGTVT